jgi:hypothetical protein
MYLHRLSCSYEADVACVSCREVIKMSSFLLLLRGGLCVMTDSIAEDTSCCSTDVKGKNRISQYFG